tara:strand:+ start:211 stop:840 length:630 start_codon:yes stop_codon:yes gene_type:complete
VTLCERSADFDFSKEKPMRHMIFTALSALLVTASIVEAGHHEKNEKLPVIGMGLSVGGESKPLYAGDLSNMKIWEEYIQAHNDRDFEKIASMNAEDFSVVMANGQIVVGSEAQRKTLEGWIQESNTTWEIQWIIPNNAENDEGEMKEWLATGQMLTMTDSEGNTSMEYHLVDVKLDEGKIALGYVASIEYNGSINASQRLEIKDLFLLS